MNCTVIKWLIFPVWVAHVCLVWKETEEKENCLFKGVQETVTFQNQEKVLVSTNYSEKGFEKEKLKETNIC